MFCQLLKLDVAKVLEKVWVLLHSCYRQRWGKCQRLMPRVQLVSVLCLQCKLIHLVQMLHL